MKLNRRQKQINKQRQQAFVNCWNVSQTKINYNALSDRFTSYYFNNVSIKRHLKKYQRAVKKQPQTMEIRKMSQLLNLKYKSPGGQLPKYSQYNISNKFINNSESSTTKRDFHKSESKLTKLEKINNSQNISSLHTGVKIKKQYFPQVKTNRVYLSKQQNIEQIDVSENLRKQKFIQYLKKKRQQIQEKRTK